MPTPANPPKPPTPGTIGWHELYAGDLETAWDKSAKVMKAANIEKWNAVDKAIDSALKKLRASSPTVADSSAALQTLIGVIEKSA